MHEPRVPWLVLYGCALALAVAPRAAASPAGAPQVVRENGARPVVVWEGARSEPLAGPNQPDAVELRTARVEGRGWVLATWPEAGAKRGAWLGEHRGGRLATLWKGQAGARDADGEVVWRVELSEAGLVRYQQASHVRHCDGQSAQLFPERFDARRRAFVPHTLPAPGASFPTLEPQTSAEDAPPPATTPLFRFTAASAPAATHGDARTLLPPSALQDHDLGTWWRTEGRAFATARSALPLPVQGIRLSAPQAAQARWPEAVLLTLGPGLSFRVDTAGAADARTLWVPLPEPTLSHCVTIEAFGAAHAPSGLAEAHVHTALGGAEAGPWIADKLASGGSCSAELRLLATLKPDPAQLAPALLARLPSAAGRAQPCLLEALASLPADSVPDAAQWLPSALVTLLRPLAALGPRSAGGAGDVLHEALPRWLRQGGEEAALRLADLAADEAQPEPARRLAAAWLANTEDEAFGRIALERFGADHGGDPKPLREALARAKGTWLPRVLAALEGAEGVRKADLVWLLHQRLPREPGFEVKPLLARLGALTDAEDFVLKARAIGALGALSHADAVARLAALGSRDPDPVVRHLAVQALGQSAGWPEAKTLALSRALSDRDPRVRQTASLQWAKAPPSQLGAQVSRLEAAHETERWPFVLPAHVEALGRSCSAEGLVLQALSRPGLPEDVYLVALETLTVCGSAAVRELALRWLEDAGAPASVRLAAAQSLRATAIPQDAQTLERSLRALVKAGASDPAQDEVAGVVLRALVPLDPSRTVEAARVMLESRRVRLQGPALESLESTCSAAAVQLLDRQLQSEDAGLASGARRSLARCQAGTP